MKNLKKLSREELKSVNGAKLAPGIGVCGGVCGSHGGCSGGFNLPGCGICVLPSWGGTVGHCGNSPI
jgi:hypothetical protein